MKKQTLAVLFGGCSSEYDISLQSAHAVLTHLDGEITFVFVYDIIQISR